VSEKNQIISRDRGSVALSALCVRDEYELALGVCLFLTRTAVIFSLCFEILLVLILPEHCDNEIYVNMFVVAAT